MTLALERPARSVFSFSHADAPPVEIHRYVPPTLSARTGVTFVLHGKLRNAAEYLEPWLSWAAEADQIVLAPRFDRRHWPGAKGYNLGNVLSRRGRRRPERRWAFTALEALHECTRAELGLESEQFALWGHSAGGQFVHRFLLLAPHARVRVAVAAGCGWFTVPDLEVEFPYGLLHEALPFTKDDLRAFVRTPLVLMRGTLDTARDSDLRVSPEADAQGANRYLRAGHMYEAAKAIDPDSPWRLLDVPGVGHDGVRMALAAQSSGLLDSQGPQTAAESSV